MLHIGSISMCGNPLLGPNLLIPFHLRCCPEDNTARELLPVPWQNTNKSWHVPRPAGSRLSRICSIATWIIECCQSVTGNISKQVQASSTSSYVSPQLSWRSSLNFPVPQKVWSSVALLLAVETGDSSIGAILRTHLAPTSHN